MSYFAHAYKKYMTYLYTFRIFVFINNIFKHTLDFKSDPYTYVIFENFYIKYTDLVQSYTWTHFQFILD